MKSIIIFLALILSQFNLFAQNEWVLQPWVQVYGDTAHQQLGSQVSYLGKKGDSTIIGVTEAASLSYGDYAVNIYYIKTQADTIPGHRYRGYDCTTGDFNGDGINDLVINGDSVCIYLAKEEGVFDTIPFFNKHAEPESYGFGSHVAVGNINGDTYQDIVITDVGYPNVQFTGRVFVYYGGETMDTVAEYILYGDTIRSGFGWNVALGDFNNDGFDNIIIRGYDQRLVDSLDYSYIKVFREESSITNEAWISFKGNNSSSEGLACFDVNGDGKKDLIWTNYSNSDSMTCVNIHYSSDKGIDSSPSLVLPDRWAMNVVNAGDMNGDGFNDILISGNNNDQYGDSYVFVYSGGPDMDTHFDAAVGKLGNSYFGHLGSIAGIGDVNGDGYDDILVGARGYKWGKEMGYWGIFLGSKYIPVTAVEDIKPAKPEKYSLLQNYPNPFNPTTTIEYELPNEGILTINIYDILGREIAALFNGRAEAGQHKVTWDASGFASGIYICRITSAGTSKNIRMVLLK